MIKLKFSKFKITTTGIVTTGEIIAILKIFIKNDWKILCHNTFSTKITLKPEDKFDLNKAYKYIQAKLEKEAYNWAFKEVKKQINHTRRDLDIFTNFADKAKHIIDHDTEYLNNF